MLACHEKKNTSGSLYAILSDTTTEVFYNDFEVLLLLKYDNRVIMICIIYLLVF